MTEAPAGSTIPPASKRSRAVLDDGAAVGPGQMTRSDYLDAVEATIQAAVDPQIASLGLSARSCPYLATAMTRYRGQSARQVEEVSRRYAGSQDTDAQELILALGERASIAARTWARQGSLDVLTSELGLAPPGDPTLQPAGYGGVSPVAPDASWVRARLGTGRPLPGTARSAAEEGFGSSLANVRIHGDGNARRLTHQVGAPALTVGEHVAVDSGAGHQAAERSVMLAHELAHAVQYGGDHGEADPQRGPDAATQERGADRAARLLPEVLAGEQPRGSAGVGLVRGRGLALRRCDGCGSSSSSTPAKAAGRFTDVSAAVRAAPDAAAKEAALAAGVKAATARADQLRSGAGSSSSPFAALRARITAETAVGSSSSTFKTLDANPLFGIGNDRVEQAYRAWAENTASSEPPWALLALWAKEGLTTPQIASAVAANSVADARAIWRSDYYFINMGIDHFTHFAATGADNNIDRSPGAGAAHDTAFTSAITAQVGAGRLPRDISGDINAELTVNNLGGGNYTVVPTSRFFSLSLMLANAYWQENHAAVQADPHVPAGTAAADVDQLTYMRWNMGSGRFGQFLARDMTGNADPDGSVPVLPTWAFHRTVRESEWGQPRANAIRFQYALDAFRLVYEW